MAVAPSPLEVVILVGLPGAGKSSFYRDRFGASHVLISKDLMGRQRDRQARQVALIDAALAAAQPVVVDNTNVTVTERAPLIAAARRRGAGVVAYYVDTPVADCRERNAARAAPQRVPVVAIHAAAKRIQAPHVDEGLDRVYRVEAAGGHFAVVQIGPAASAPYPTVFLLSPASTSGVRAAQLLRDGAAFPLAARVRSAAGAPLGEVFAFLSSLYFRGKLAYARAFARPPAGLCGAFVITPGEGLRDPAEPITLARLRAYAAVPITPGERRFLGPLRRDAEALALLAGRETRVILLGSVASARYVEPLLAVFGERLLFPPAFVGRGDMSRGGLLLRCVDAGQELEYAPLHRAVRHGPRPPRLPRRARR